MRAPSTPARGGRGSTVLVLGPVGAPVTVLGGTDLVRSARGTSADAPALVMGLLVVATALVTSLEKVRPDRAREPG